MRNPNDVLVSVLIPTYQRRETVTRAVETALQQTHSNIEVVVYDDGSTDETADELGKLKDKRLVYVRCKENKGEPSARNELLKIASGEYAFWLDSDDVTNIWRAESQLYALLRMDKYWVCSGTDELGKNDKRWSGPPRISWTLHHSMPTVMFKTAFAKQYDTRYRYCACDMKWELEMIDSYGPPIYLPLQLYYLNYYSNLRMSDQDHKPLVAVEYEKNKKRLAEERNVFYRKWKYSLKEIKPVVVPSWLIMKTLERAYSAIEGNEIGFIVVDKAWNLAHR